MAVDLNRLCMGCMNILPHPQAVCPHCGWSRQSDQNGASQLAQETRLKNPGNGKEYLIGKAIGQGGFGIVYVGWDIANNRKVAVKEYYPYSRIVNRTRSNTVNVTPNTQENIDFFNHQKKRFRQEAQKMMLFNDSPNIVHVIEFFEANNTAYIVMEFIEGQTFTKVLERSNGRMSLETVLANFKPIVDILERIHTTPFTDEDGWHAGIIHRDISPENIMYPYDGSVKLLDFGAARSSDPTNPTGILKHGYAPWEQYLSKGSAATQGSWTDVYAFAATIYQAITGKLPPKSIDRSVKDTIEMPRSLGVNISSEQEQILLKGLAVDYRNRYQSVKQFYDDLIKQTYQPQIQTPNPQVQVTPQTLINPPQPTTPQSDSSWKKIAWGVAAVAVIAALFLHNKIGTKQVELGNLKSQIQANQERMTNYGNFTADYGYGSDSYYADKAVVFVNKNSEVKLPIYCDQFKTKEDHVSCNCADGKGLVDLKWESSFDKNHKANVIITTGDNAGYATIKFTNTMSSDNFEVLVVVLQ